MGSEGPQLSGHIWALIATKMNVKEWGCVAGTCEASWDVQLKNIYINRKLGVEGVPLRQLIPHSGSRM